MVGFDLASKAFFTCLIGGIISINLDNKNELSKEPPRDCPVSKI